MARSLNRRWVEPAPVRVPLSLREAVGGHPLIAQTLVRRGFADVQAALGHLDPAVYQPAAASELPGVSAAVERLIQAIRDRETIGVWGDFDVDGQTSTSILVSTLREMGAEVVYHIPVREVEGHGVNVPWVDRLIDGGVGLILTCDTGISAHAPVAHARRRGVDVIVTDHHDLPTVLPDAVTIVNPKLLPTEHALRELPAVGVAYVLACALYETAERGPDVEQYLDLVALGIVADVAVQVRDVRYLLQRGLACLRRTRRAGLIALMEIADVNPDWLTEEHVGFELAPRLNALGRLADANVAVEFLTTDDALRARIIAQELEGHNVQRRRMSEQVFQAAVEQIERDPSLLDAGVLVLTYPAWEGGVLGIVAGRLAQRYGVPAILLSGPPDGLARGSARSIPGVNITDAIATQSGILEGFGGHPMAAGLSLCADRIGDFRRGVTRAVRDLMAGARPEIVLEIDAYVPLADLSLDLVEELERLAPFGSGNPPITLASQRLRVVNSTAIGRSREHLRLEVEDESGAAQTVLWWQGAGGELPDGQFDLAYVVRASDFRGERHVEVEWVDARVTEEAPSRLAPEPREIRVIDYRDAADPLRQLLQLLADNDIQVWGEGEDARDLGGERRVAQNRQELIPGRRLAIWTAPPGPVELREVLKRVEPECVYLFGVDPDIHRPHQFLKVLAGLANHVIHVHSGRVSLSTLAARTAQRDQTVREGLGWLVARGHLTLNQEPRGELILARGSGVSSDDLGGYERRLSELLNETAAYRRHFLRADPESLISR